MAALRVFPEFSVQVMLPSDITDMVKLQNKLEEQSFIFQAHW